MLGIIIIVASVSIMAKVAEMEERSSVNWGVITLVLCLVCGALIPIPLLNLVAGLVVSFIAMFALKAIQG